MSKILFDSYLSCEWKKYGVGGFEPSKMHNTQLRDYIVRPNFGVLHCFDDSRALYSAPCRSKNGGFFYVAAKIRAVKRGGGGRGAWFHGSMVPCFRQQYLIWFSCKLNSSIQYLLLSLYQKYFVLYYFYKLRYFMFLTLPHSSCS